MTSKDDENALNVFEQRPVWRRLVINVAFCFPLPRPIDSGVIVGRLQDGLDRLTASFPWLAGHVITEGDSPAAGSSGVSKIVPGRTGSSKIIVKDHRQAATVPDMEDLRRTSYAVGMLDESVFAPRPAVVAIPPEEKPLFQMQANILSCGLILVFSGCHSAMDLPGLIQLLRWFSKSCHDEPFTASELQVGNLSRRNLVPLLDSTYEQGEELAHQVSAMPTTGPLSPSVSAAWATFIIPSEAVKAIKATAMVTRTSAYVSTDDSLSAFLWQSIARARAKRLAPETITTASRAVDVRRVLGIPREYPGLVQNNLFHKFSLGELVELPLGVVASEFRDAITRSSPSLEFYSRALATALSRSSDKSSLRIGANMDFSSDILLSSCITSGASSLDFALGLGTPEAVRITHQAAFESMVYMMPSTLQGDVPLVMGLRDADLAALNADQAFCERAQFVG